MAAVELNGKPIPDKWVAVLKQYAAAYQDTGIAADVWYESNVNDGKWGSAKRYITRKNAKLYLELTANIRTKPNTNTAKNRTSTKRKTAKNRTDDIPPESTSPINDHQSSSAPKTVDRGGTPDIEVAQNQSGAKRRPGGQPGNQNAVTHGLYSRFLIPEEREVHDSVFGMTDALHHELAFARARLASAIAKDANLKELDKLIAEGAEAIGTKEYLNHAPLELESWSWFDGADGNLSNGETWTKRRPDLEGAIDRWTARVQSLESIIDKMRNGLAMSRNEQLAYQSTVYQRLTDTEITSVEAGRLLEQVGIKVPTGLALEIRVELANPAIDDEGGITEEELDRIVEEGRLHDEQQGEFLKERRAWLDERFKEDG